MISEKCVRGVLGRAVVGSLCAVSDYEMSTLGVRGAAHTTALDARGLRVRAVCADTVRRNLFGSMDADENRRFLERELQHQLEIDSQRWGFDFAKERPLAGRQRFTWTLVAASSVPAALRTPAPAPAPAPPAPHRQQPHSPQPTKTQKRITDFLKPCKRLSGGVGAGKKASGGEGGAPKRARLGPPPAAAHAPPTS